MDGSSAPISPLLVMRGIAKRFNGVPALSGASLEVGRGEVHALIGQNGAGKSTMIKILTGYYTKDAGEIWFNGAPFHADSPKNAQAGGISTIYQEINLIPYRSVRRTLAWGTRHAGLVFWIGSGCTEKQRSCWRGLKSKSTSASRSRRIQLPFN